MFPDSMAYVVPTLNIDVRYWSRADWWAGWPGVVPPETSVLRCQLRAGARVAHGFDDVPFVALPQLVVDPSQAIDVPTYDTAEWWYWMSVVEVPSGSGYFYLVSDVAIVAGGFANAYLQLDLFPGWVLQGAAFSSLTHWPYTPIWPVVAVF